MLGAPAGTAGNGAWLSAERVSVVDLEIAGFPVGSAGAAQEEGAPIAPNKPCTDCKSAPWLRRGDEEGPFAVVPFEEGE